MIRQSYQEIGNELRRKNIEYLSLILLGEIAKLPREAKVVVEGFRNPGEVVPFSKEEKFVLLGLDAPVQTRFERLHPMGRDPKSWEEFSVLEKRDQGQGEPVWGLQVAKTLKLADIIVDTSESKEFVFKKVDKFLEEYL